MRLTPSWSGAVSRRAVPTMFDPVICFRKGQRVCLPVSSPWWTGTIIEVWVPANGARIAKVKTDSGEVFSAPLRELREAA